MNTRLAMKSAVAEPYKPGAASILTDIRMRATRRRPPVHAPRLFLYSHDTYGLGHLRRNLAIAEHLLSRAHPYSVRLLTGSPVINDWILPAALDVTALPSVVKTGVETYTPRNSELPFGLVKAHREASILKSVIEESPDILLVDHAPGGMNGELLSTLTFIRREMPETQVVLGLRDILDSPKQVCRIWQQQGIIPLLEHLYDRILVYGSRELYDVVENYGIPDKVAAKLTYCGYVVCARQVAIPRGPGQRFNVLVTAGGGEDGFFLMEAYLKALARIPVGKVHSTIVTGPLMSVAERRTLDELSAGDPNIEIVALTTDLPKMLQSADLVVSMAGYNTSVEIIASRKPAILVPRSAPRAEQRLRASILSQMGFVWSLEQAPDLDARMAALIESASAGQTPHATGHALDLNGAARVGQLFDAMTTIQSNAEAIG